MKKTRAKSPEPIASRGRPKDSAKRDSIIRAASTLFFKDGYELTSMEAIARKADVSKLTIYSHFANKDELFREVISRRCEQRALNLTTTSDETVEVALSRIGMDLAKLMYSPDSIHLHRIIHAEAAHHPKVVRLFYDAGPKRVRAAFSELLRHWNKQGSLDVPDITRATEQFFSLLKGEPLMKILMLLAAPPDTAEIKKHVKATVTLFLAGYKAKPSREAK